MESMQGGSGFLSEYLYVGDLRVAQVANLGPIYYYYGDHLGTARLITDGAGNKCYDADYFPGRRAACVRQHLSAELQIHRQRARSRYRF